MFEILSVIVLFLLVSCVFVLLRILLVIKAAVISKIARIKTRQGESLLPKVDVGGETVRVFDRPEELAERLEARGYDIPASEVQAGFALDLPCLVVTSQGSSGHKIIEEFLPEGCLTGTIHNFD